LADTAQDCITQIIDCGTKKYLEIRSLTKAGNTIMSIGTRAFGRTLAEDLVDDNNNIIGKAGQIVDVSLRDKIDELEMISVKIRSPVTCEYSGAGICCACYGYDLSSLKPVKKHVAVGIIAAQSIGEPGTQLTMKNFQSGGAAQNITGDSRITAISSGFVRLPNVKAAEFEGNKVVISRNNLIDLVDAKDRIISSHRIPYGAHINVEDKQKIKKGDLIASWDPYILPIIAEKNGTVSFYDLVKDVSYKEVFDYNIGLVKYIVKQNTDRFSPSLRLKTGGEEIEYFVQAHDSIEVENGTEVMAGQILVQRTQNIVKSQDIVGGLPLVGDLFEARTPKNLCIMSEVAGRVEVLRGNQQKVIIHTETGRKEYSIPRNVNIIVDSGDEIQVGDHLTDGRPSMHSLLNLKGPEEMSLTFIDEIQNVYQMQGIFIADKHIEIMLRQMLGSAVIVDPGQTALLKDDVIRVDRIAKLNDALMKFGKTQITFKPVLNGISKAAISEKTAFFAAASFQGTIQRLTEAVILNEVDPLSGMKAALITGQFIPAGVGGLMHEIQSSKRTMIESKVLENAIKDQIV
jgi:DNA-directed RNA polymerase subunit beta'